jgi:hypothetical protein
MNRYHVLILTAAAIASASCTARPSSGGGVVIEPAMPEPAETAARTEIETNRAIVSGQQALGSTASAPEAAATTTACLATTQVYGEWLAGKIVGADPDSRVNVRPEPSLDAATQSYGLVGEDIAIIAEATAADCGKWYQASFPGSGHRGWINAEFAQVN